MNHRMTARENLLRVVSCKSGGKPLTFLTTTSDFKEKTKKRAKRLLRVHVFYALEKVEVVFP